jgi:glucose-6-phosphate-specific signal transduction histidine kinase
MRVNAPADRFRLSGRELALIFLFWTSLAVLSSANRILGARDFGFGRVMTPTGPILLAFLEAWTWAAFTPLIFWLSSRSSLTRSRWIRIPLLLLIGIAIAIAVYVLLDFTRGAILPDSPRRRGGSALLMPLREIGRFRFLNQFIVYLAVLATGFAREYFLSDRRREQQAVQLQAQLAEARLDALRMQINPHFLFNTLNAVSALVERDPAGVRRMIARLSELLRHTIDSRAADEVPLREELAFLQRYIDIMEIRFQGRLNVKTAFDDDVLDALVPNLILQPLVENALEHGVSRVVAGKVEIAARRDGARIVLSVRDNGPGLDAVHASGVGLTNTRARLDQLYAGAASLTFTAAEGGGTLATIELPYRRERGDA